MTNLTNHVVSLELAKELKEAGYPQEASFYWAKDKGYMGEISVEGYGLVYVGESSVGSWHILEETECIAAPLASEIGERLPWVVNFENAEYQLKIMKELGDINEYYWTDYHYVDGGGCLVGGGQTDDVNFSNSVAKLWLYLKRNNLLTEAQ